MKKIEQVFKASDGTEYKTAELAEQREKLIAVSDEFKTVLRKVKNAMCEASQTADGHAFAMGTTYYLVVDSMSGPPYLFEFWAYPHDLTIDLESDGLVVRKYSYDNRRGSQYITHKICELYADKRKAKEALFARCDQRLAEMTEDIRRIKADE